MRITGLLIHKKEIVPGLSFRTKLSVSSDERLELVGT
jgi:hypothetical protein